MMAASLMLLGGCMDKYIENFSNVPPAKEAKAHEVLYSHEVVFATDDATLGSREGGRLQAFIAKANISRTDKVHIVANPTDLAEARMLAVAGILEKIGVVPAPVLSDFGFKAPSGPSVSVIVRRFVVSLPGCPDWSGERFTYNNVPTGNWGCSTASNLGLMVAEPEDLMHGRDPGNADGTAGARSVDLYRRGQTKALQVNVISDVQQQAGASQSGGAAAGGGQ